jgi:hypothetical protein
MIDLLSPWPLIRSHESPGLSTLRRVTTLHTGPAEIPDRAVFIDEEAFTDPMIDAIATVADIGS